MREDSDILPSSWALVAEGSLGSGAAEAVEVLKDDAARLEHLRMKERLLTAQLGTPLTQTGALLAQHHFDLQLARARPENPDERRIGATAHEARQLLDWSLEGYGCGRLGGWQRLNVAID